MVFIVQIWAAKSTTLASMIAARIVGAVFAATGQGLVEVVISDLFYVHQRGGWMGVAVIAMSTGNPIAVAAGFLITAYGWQWYYWVSSSRSPKFSASSSKFGNSLPVFFWESA